MAKTSVPGWASVHGWQEAEQVMIVNRVTNRMLNEATVVIDILEAKCIKCRSGIDVGETYTNALIKYKPAIEKAVAAWLEQASIEASNTLAARDLSK
jgi:hypothetical protein